MSKYKILFTGQCCCGKRRYSVIDKTNNKFVTVNGLTRKEAKDTIAQIEALES